jgi:hypothetical protein
MDWFKKHVDTVVILSAFAASILWMNGKFNEVERKISELDKELAIVKTVMIMQKIMPVDLCHTPEDKK